MPRRTVGEIRNADSALSPRARLVPKAAELSGVRVGSSGWGDRAGWVGWRVLVVFVVVGGLLFGPVVGVSAARDEITAGQARAEQWWLESLGVSAAHEITRGAGVRVCVIDTGPAVSHPDLRGVDFQDGQDLTGRGSPDGLTSVDDDDHGVAMIGLIAGQGHGQGVGLLGTAPEATIISVTVGDLDVDTQAKAYKACADAGAGVISLSLGSRPLLGAMAYLQARDVVLVGAAGNDGSRDGVTNSGFGEVSVGGVNAQLRLDSWSNAGGPSLIFPGRLNPLFDTGGVAITAPFSIESKGPDRSGGVGLVTLTQGGGYRRSSGTSNATAITAGVVALVRARYPELNAANVVNRLLVTAQPPNDEAFDPAEVPSPLYGWGVVDAYAALTEDVPEVEHNPLGSIYVRNRRRMWSWRRLQWMPRLSCLNQPRPVRLRRRKLMTRRLPGWSGSPRWWWP